MSQTTFDAAGRHAIALEYYDTPTLVFHWLTALLVVVLFATSWVWNTWPHNHWRHSLESAHVSLGILFAALIVLRAIWRFTGSRHIAPVPGLSGALSRIMYIALYTLMVVETVTGFVLRWCRARNSTSSDFSPYQTLSGRTAHSRIQSKPDTTGRPGRASSLLPATPVRPSPITTCSRIKCSSACCSTGVNPPEQSAAWFEVGVERLPEGPARQDALAEFRGVAGELFRREKHTI